MVKPGVARDGQAGMAKMDGLARSCGSPDTRRAGKRRSRRSVSGIVVKEREVVVSMRGKEGAADVSARHIDPLSRAVNVSGDGNVNGWLA